MATGVAEESSVAVARGMAMDQFGAAALATETWGRAHADLEWPLL
jgi:hypothetical protein